MLEVSESTSLLLPDPVSSSECWDKLDLESIGSSIGIDWDLIWSGVEWSGPAIRPGLDNIHLIIECHWGLRR